MDRRFFVRKLAGVAAVLGLGGVGKAIAVMDVAASEPRNRWRIVIKSIKMSYHMNPEGSWRVLFDVISPSGETSNLAMWSLKYFKSAKLPWPKDSDQVFPEVCITGINEFFCFDADQIGVRYKVKHWDGRVEERCVAVDRGDQVSHELDLS